MELECDVNFHLNKFNFAQMESLFNYLISEKERLSTMLLEKWYVENSSKEYELKISLFIVENFLFQLQTQYSAYVTIGKGYSFSEPLNIATESPTAPLRGA